MTAYDVVNGNCFGTNYASTYDLCMSIFWLVVIGLAVKIVLKYCVPATIVNNEIKQENNNKLIEITEINELKITQYFKK